MAVKTITITVDAYDRLFAMKGQNESFSDVVNKISARSALGELVGCIDNPLEFETKLKQFRGNEQ